MPPKPIPSRMALRDHPLHPALIHFPIAALLMLLGTDVALVLTADPFWFRAGLWLAGIGVLGGWLSGVVGLIDLVTVAPIRRLITAWCHAILAVMLLSLASLNWLLRLQEGLPVVQPWGIGLSLLTSMLIAATGFLGGQLVFEHAVGVDLEEAGAHQRRART